MRIGTANVGTLTGRDGEVVDMAYRRRLDLHCYGCLQEQDGRGLGPGKLANTSFSGLDVRCKFTCRGELG